jgi:CRP-like cAMP-binding protein
VNTPKPHDSLHHLLARKFRGYDEVSDAEINVLEDAIKGTRTFAAGSEILRTDERVSTSCLLSEGWAARSKLLRDGSRQITSIHIPGDFVDLHAFLLHKMDHSVVALVPCRIALVPHENLKRISEKQPHLSRLFWVNTVVDGAIHRNWLTALGRLPAANRMAQLVCEIYTRLAAVGLAKDLEFDLPLTQPVVADALGLSLVHVSRSLQEIRRLELLTWRSRTVKILDWDRLAEFAEFDPTYLSLTPEPR